MKSFLRFFFCFFFLASFNFQILSQITERKKPKLKNFGSSLKRTPQENLVYSKKKKEGNSDDEDAIRIETNLVIFDYLVLNPKGFPVNGLKKEDFIVTEDDQPQEIQTFTTGNDANIPRSIVLIIDYSGSQSLYLNRSIEAAKLLIDKLRPNDLMAVITDDVEIIADYTNDKIKLKKRLDSLKPGNRGYGIRRYGKSEQYGALYSVLNEAFDEEDVRPIVIFQTDGDQLMYLKGECKDKIFCPSSDNKLTNFSFGDLLTMTDKARASIYTVVPGFNMLNLSPEEKRVKMELEEKLRLQALGFNSRNLPESSEKIQKKRQQFEELKKLYYPSGFPDPQEALAKLSDYSGGWIDFLEKPEQADEIYSKILSQIELRYVISYSPTNEAKDGKHRKVKVSIRNHPEYIIWGRRTYLAPLPD